MPIATRLRMATIAKMFLTLTGMLILAGGCSHGNGRLASPASAALVPEPPAAVESPAASIAEPGAPRDLSGLFKKNDGGGDLLSAGSGSEDMDAASQARPPDWSLFRSIAAVVLTLGGLVAVNRFLRRRMRRTATDDDGEDMRVIGALPLDHQRRLLLVAVEGKRALLCSGRDGVTSIATFDSPATTRLPSPGEDKPAS